VSIASSDLALCITEVTSVSNKHTSTELPRPMNSLEKSSAMKPSKD
jgi:hypothetical protein